MRKLLTLLVLMGLALPAFSQFKNATNGTALATVTAPSGNTYTIVDSGAGPKNVQLKNLWVGGATNTAFDLSAYVSSDTDLTLGGTNTGTDVSETLQKVFDQATNGPIKVNWNVAVSLGKSVLLRSNTRIDVAAGGGARLKPNANCPLLQNYHCTDATNQANWLTAPDYSLITSDTNIVINGGIWDGNAPHQLHDTATNGWVSALRFMNIRNLTLNDITVYQPRTFAVHFANWNNVTVKNFYGHCIDTTAVNRDGLHFNGPGRGAIVQGVRALFNDDVVAISANDIDQQGDGSRPVLSPFANSGDIYDVTVKDVQLLDGGLRGIRLLSSTNIVDNVLIDGVTGIYGAHTVVCDNYGENPTYMRGVGPGYFGNITIQNVQVTPSQVDIGKASQMFFGSIITNLNLRNLVFNRLEGGNNNVIRIRNQGANCTALVYNCNISGLTVQGPTNEVSVPLRNHIAVENGALIGNINVSGFTAIRRSERGTNLVGTVLFCDTSSYITNAFLNGINAPYFLNELLIYSRPQTNVFNWKISQSDVLPLARGDTTTSGVYRDYTIQDGYFLNTLVNTSRDALFGGSTAWRTNGTFSAIIKMPEAWSGGNNLAVGMRCLWNNSTSTSRDGYLVVINTSAVTLYKSTALGSLTSLGTLSVSLTADAEYRVEIECQGTTINARVQRISDEQWLGSGATFAAGRQVAITATDSTYLHGNCWISNYAGTSTDKTIRIRDIRYF